jgi:hypothetical protein
MVCAIKKIDSNDTGFSLAEEECLNQLRQNGVYTDVVWHSADPNTYNPPPGAQYTRVARQPISKNHKRRKGNIVDRDANFGTNDDLTAESFKWRSQGVFFADAHERATTDGLNTPILDLTNVDGTANEYEAATGLTIFAVNNLVVASNFTNAGNNGLTVVTTVAAGALGVARDLVDEPAPPVNAFLAAVGHRLAAGVAALTVTSSAVTLTSSAPLPAILAGLLPGEWVFVGGDAVANQFALNAPGFARVKAVVGQTIVFDKTDWVPAADVGAAKLIDIYVGVHVRDEPNPANIKRRTYSGEMTLGNDGVGTQSQYVDGAVMNLTTVNAPLAGLVTFDQTFMACNRIFRKGAQGLRGGTYLPINPNDYSYNTTSDEVRIQLSIAGGAINQPSVIGIVNNFTLTFNNNLSANKGQGILGPFEITRGDFVVGGAFNTYFVNVDGPIEIPKNTTFSFDAIFAAGNTAVAFDVPALALGGGDLEVVKDQAIMLNLTNEAFENEFGTTASVTFFAYIPTVGMPTPDEE